MRHHGCSRAEVGEVAGPGEQQEEEEDAAWPLQPCLGWGPAPLRLCPPSLRSGHRSSG